MSMTTPERVLVEHEVAGVGSRAVAQLIDVLLLVVVEGAVVFGVAALSTVGLPRWLLFTLLIVFAGGLPIAYFTLFEWRSGATLGKRSMRIRVVTEHGTPISARESLTRNLLRLIDFLPAFYVLGGIVATASSKSQRLGDLAAGTIAVRPPRRTGPKVRRNASFVELTATHEQAEGNLTPELLAVIESFVYRRKKLAPEMRSHLAARIARNIPASQFPHELGQTDEEYIAMVHRHHLEQRMRSVK
jgi:uncharacterized RDD family membrane protein YckC